MSRNLNVPEVPVLVVVDDDPVMRLILRRALEPDGYRIVEARDGGEALAAFASHGADIVLIDAVMPGMDGFETCRRLREYPAGKHCPLVMITGLKNDDSVEAAFAAGATDFITKPIQWDVLRQRVRQLLYTAHAERRAHYLAYHDTLTGLRNRSWLAERFVHARTQAQRGGQVLALLFIDLDRFKIVNDSLGHDVGDQLLQQVASRLTACVRKSDTVARLGGDEFIVLLEGLESVEQAGAVATKLVDSLRPPVPIESHQLMVPASIGIAIYPFDGEEFGELIKHADTAMDRAKVQGGNRHGHYHKDMSARVSRRWALERGLRQALDRDEFVVHYQPVVDLASGQPIGAEALLRWERPGEGLVAPAEFIPLAEETGLILPIGERVLRHVCTQIRQWRSAQLPPFYVALNLSSLQLHQTDLATMVARAMQTEGIEGQSLVLEITESVLMDNAPSVVNRLHALKALGVRLSIDDFGTGYSSLSYLKRFPVDILKIDRSFVCDIPGDGDSTAIASAIIALAHQLKREVVAEGVEAPAQAELLRERGCDAAQGYLYCRPLPATQLEQWLWMRAKRPVPAGRQAVPPATGPGRCAAISDSRTCP